MPGPLQQSASSLKSVHLLRALLREASYLPDATARTFFRRHIVHRFKAYQPKQNATASFDVEAVDKYRHRSFKRRQIAIIHERTRPLLRKAQKGLNYLQRANQGQLFCLQKVLFFTYGRIGRRKYALLEKLLQPDPYVEGGPAVVNGVEGPAPLQQLYYSSERYLKFFDAPKKTSATHHTIGISDRYSRLRIVLKSQYSKGISLRVGLKAPFFKTPINNIWERPMPIVRARNNVRRWYAETMTRLLPPLPTKEWDDIHAMIVKQKHISFTKRRSPAIVLDPDTVSREEQSATIIQRALNMTIPTRAERPVGIDRPHKINTKFMRRLYTRLLTLCCKLEYDYQRKTWNAVWGSPMKIISPDIYNQPTDESLFDGVDATGRIPVQKKEGPFVIPRNSKGDYVRFPFFTEFLPKEHHLQIELATWKKQREVAAKEYAERAAGGEEVSTPPP